MHGSVPTRLTLGELFCGPGGMSLGASAVAVELENTIGGFDHKWANDIDENTCRTFARNIPGATADSVIIGDVRKLDLKSLPPVDCLAFGFPCNDFSIVGERLGIQGEYGPLYTYCVQALEALEPICFVAENVGGLSSSNGGLTLSAILSAFAAVGPGYNLVAHLYKAEEYGVPQRRRRILIVGVRADVGRKFRVPTPTTKLAPPTVYDALVKYPLPDGVKNNELTKQSQTVMERLKHIKPGQNAFNADLPEHLKLNVRGATISQIYRRLSLEEPSYTITGSGGGGTHVYHWQEDRALTNRERARLQGFPDDFVFLGSKEGVRGQIGMAVPPALATTVFTALFKSLHKIPYEGMDPNIEIDSPEQLALALERKNAYR